jgi:hypothetical protein
MSQAGPKFKFLKRGEGTYKRVYASKLRAQQRTTKTSSDSHNLETSVQGSQAIEPASYVGGGGSSDLRRGSTNSDCANHVKHIRPQTQGRGSTELEETSVSGRLVSPQATSSRRPNAAVRHHPMVSEEALGPPVNPTAAKNSPPMGHSHARKHGNGGEIYVSRPFGALVRTSSQSGVPVVTLRHFQNQLRPCRSLFHKARLPKFLLVSQVACEIHLPEYA